jgi:hypothetical protein
VVVVFVTVLVEVVVAVVVVVVVEVVTVLVVVPVLVAVVVVVVYVVSHGSRMRTPRALRTPCSSGGSPSPAARALATLAWFVRATTAPMMAQTNSPTKATDTTALRLEEPQSSGSRRFTSRTWENEKSPRLAVGL